MALFFWGTAQAEEDVRYRPYILGSNASGSLDSVVEDSRQKLTTQGFEVVGEYAPYDGAHILIVTNDALKKQAAASEFGGYGAAQRVSITKVNESVQVSYTNPFWMSNVYRMSGDLTGIAESLEKALGAQQDFGSS